MGGYLALGHYERRPRVYEGLRAWNSLRTQEAYQCLGLTFCLSSLQDLDRLVQDLDRLGHGRQPMRTLLAIPLCSCGLAPETTVVSKIIPPPPKKKPFYESISRGVIDYAGKFLPF